jgi:hypothetical protein
VWLALFLDGEEVVRKTPALAGFSGEKSMKAPANAGVC